ncbi:MAG: hypothetical protein NXH75_05725 [Halobacteriovoraceae bacterium]|nr:hypothetical protein [Halobacteriovoraceae bacterium]
MKKLAKLLFVVFPLVLPSCKMMDKLNQAAGLATQEEMKELKQKVSKLEKEIEKLKAKKNQRASKVLKDDLAKSRFKNRFHLNQKQTVTTNNSTDTLVAELMADHYDFERQYGKTKFTREQLKAILKAKPNVLEELSKANIIDKELLEIILANWKVEEIRGSFHKGRTLIGILAEHGMSLNEEQTKRVVDADINSVAFLKDFSSSSKTMNELTKKAKEKTLKMNEKDLSDLDEVILFLAENDKSYAKKISKKLYGLYVGKLKKSRSYSSGELNKTLEAANLTPEGYRKLFGITGRNLCDGLNRVNLGFIAITEKEALRCVKRFRNSGLLHIYLKSQKKDLHLKVLKTIAKESPTILLRLPKEVKSTPAIKKLQSKYKKIFKKNLLRKHIEISQMITSNPRGSFVRGGCSEVFPENLLDDKEVVISGTLALPLCTALLPEKVWKDKYFRKSYLKAWKNLRESIENLKTTTYDRATKKRVKSNANYFVYLKNKFPFYRGGRSSKLGQIKFSPLKDIPTEIYKDDKFVLEALKAFPEDYLSLPLIHREKFSKYKEIAEKSSYNLLYNSH